MGREKLSQKVVGEAVLRIDGTVETMNLGEDISREKFSVMIATVYDGSMMIYEELKLRGPDKIFILSGESSIEIKKIDNRRFSVIIRKSM